MGRMAFVDWLFFSPLAVTLEVTSPIWEIKLPPINTGGSGERIREWSDDFQPQSILYFLIQMYANKEATD